MNWGLRITILYLGFVALIVTMAGMSSREKVDLVAKDYYEQELKFQTRLDMSARSNALNEPMTWEVTPGELVLKFPGEFAGKSISGSVYFFRPSDVSLDKTIPITSEKNISRRLSTDNVKEGFYKMEITWEVDGKKFYNEGIINVN